MKRRSLTVVLLIVAVAGFVAVYNRTGNAAQDAKQIKWEYCALPAPTAEIKDGKVISSTRITYFLAKGATVAEFRAERSLDTNKLNSLSKKDTPSYLTTIQWDADNEALGKAIGMLGDEGWEMIGEQPFNAWSMWQAGDRIQTMAFYFKRQKS